jgi:hypothetical protein
VVKPILGWSCNALETVDAEIFNSLAISLMVAGFAGTDINAIYNIYRNK